MIYEKSGLVQGLTELFKYAFVTNCHLDQDSITLEESNAIHTFDPIELLENFKDLILNLLKFKKEYKNLEPAENFSENLLLKHETELQYHVRLESELKSQLENSKSREEKLFKNYESALQRIKELEVLYNEKFKSDKVHKWDEIKSDLCEKIRQLNEKIDLNDKNTKRLELENSRLRGMLEEKFIEIEILKKNIGKSKKSVSKLKDNKNLSVVEICKRQIEEKAVELISNQQKVRDRIYVKMPLKDSNRENRKSLCQQDFSKVSQFYEKPIRGHVRSYSDYKA